MVRTSGKKAYGLPTSGEATLTVPVEEHFWGRCAQYAKTQLLRRMDKFSDRADWQKLKDSQLGGVVRLGARVKARGVLLCHIWVFFLPSIVLIWMYETIEEIGQKFATQVASMVPASKVLQETCNYIRNLHREVDDLSDRLSQLLATLDVNSEEASIIRSLFN